MASRSLADLHPNLKPLCQWFMEECGKHDLNPLITCTYRSDKEQMALYAQGRTNKFDIGTGKPLKIVTHAKAGQSPHNFTLNGKPASRAFDVVPIVNGKPMWDGEHPAWEEMGELGESIGLEWGGRWLQPKTDMPHFQLREGT